MLSPVVRCANTSSASYCMSSYLHDQLQVNRECCTLNCCWRVDDSHQSRVRRFNKHEYNPPKTGENEKKYSFSALHIHQRHILNRYFLCKDIYWDHSSLDLYLCETGLEVLHLALILPNFEVRYAGNNWQDNVRSPFSPDLGHVLSQTVHGRILIDWNKVTLVKLKQGV